MRRRWPSAILVAGLLVGACTTTTDEPSPNTVGDGAGPTGPDEASASADAPLRPSPTVEGGGAVPALGEATVGWEVAAEGFTAPLQVLVDEQGGETLVVEQVGRVTTLDGAVVLDIADSVAFAGERGLLGAAFHPTEDALLVHFSDVRDGSTTLMKVPRVDGSFQPVAGQVLFHHEQPAANHNGGSVVVGPDGAVYLALGDGGGGGDTFGNGQDPATALGTIQRFDPATFEPEMWAYGLRNPYRIAFDDDWLYIADVGQDAVEEIDAIPAGEQGVNYGWPIMEGSRCFRATECDSAGLILPVAEHTHDEGLCSVIGGVVATGLAHPALAGAFVYSDYCASRLWAVRASGGGAVEAADLGADVPGRPLGFGHDADGHAMVGTAEGTVFRLVRR